MTLQQRLIALQAELDGLNKIQSKFLIKSPVDGRIKNFANLSINQWVSNLDELMGIVKYGTGSVVGFVKESQIDRFKLKEHAVFIPFDGQHSKVKLISQNLDLSAVSILPYPALSSNYGGPIATRAFEKSVLPHITNKNIKIIVDKIFALGEVAKAQDYMEKNENFGKIVLKIKD